MRAALVSAFVLALGGAAAAQTASPGQSATDRILDPTKPAPVVSPATPVDPTPSAPAPRATGPLSTDEMRALLDAARETAKATRESVDYGRVVPDILTQVLAKLDKLEDKLDRIDAALRQGARRR